MRYLRKAAKRLARKRWENKSEKQKREHCRMMARAFWDRLGPEERSEIMRERARVRDGK